MTTVKFEIGRLYSLRANHPWDETAGLPAQLIDGKWTLTHKKHVKLSKEDSVLMIARFAENPGDWFVGLAHGQTVLLPKDEFVRFRG